MKIIISPAKKMRTDDALAPLGVPVYQSKAMEVLEKLRSMTDSQLQSMWNCNDKIAQENMERLPAMEGNQTPAIFAYDGIQFKYMAPTVFENKMLEYVQNHLRILSGFYGAVKPMDGVSPYRLEMQAPLEVGEHKNLYQFWGEEIYDQVADDGVILNLASKEYSKCVEPYLKATDHYVTCVFGEWSGEKVVQKATFAKMARGEMVRYMAEHDVKDLEEIKGFDRLGFVFQPDRSSETEFVFVREKADT